MSTEAWVSVDAVAKHLSVAKDSIYRWIEYKRLPAHRVGRLWKFKLSQIDEWVRAGGAAIPAVVGRPPPAGQVRDRLATMLSAAFEAEPVEDGVAHTAEEILERALRTGDQSTMLEIVAALCMDVARPGLSAATLRCLGRLTRPGSSAWRSDVVRRALDTPRCGTPRCRGAGGRVVGRRRIGRRVARSSRARALACRVHHGSHRRSAGLSAFFARKITRAKWMRHPELSAGEIAADAVTADLRTSGNALSFWRCGSAAEVEVERVALAMAAAGDRIDRLDLVWIAGEQPCG